MVTVPQTDPYPPASAASVPDQDLTAARVPAATPWTAPTAAGPVVTAVRLPGSKSMTARALILAALAQSSSTIGHPLRARDTTLMAAGLAALGTGVSTMDDTQWAVEPAKLHGPAHIDVGLAGTVMRFLPPVAALADGPVTFDGDPHARKRPMVPLLRALADLGVAVEPGEGGGLPLLVRGAGGVLGGAVTIDASTSSQFVSALLLAAPAFERGLVVRHEGPPVPSAPHLRMTTTMLREAGAVVDESVPDAWDVRPGPIACRPWLIEPDLSGAAPFLAAALVTGGEVSVPGWPRATTQPGDQLRDLLTAMGGSVTVEEDGLRVRGTGTVHGLDADLSDVSELTPVLAALAALADGPSRLRGIGHIRGHETNRVAALATELTALGAEVAELPDGLEIRPRPLHGAPFATYADHRMAHAAAVIGLVVPGVVLDDVACTSKTMPEFPDLWRSIAGGTHPAGAAI
jgi:3-phosphoshikimate 1-carboxyvinyltransferase